MAVLLLLVSMNNINEFMLVNFFNRSLFKTAFFVFKLSSSYHLVNHLVEMEQQYLELLKV